MLTLLDKIVEHILGHKYYLVTLEEVQFSKNNPAEHGRRSVSNYIFRDKESAKVYYYQMKSTRTYQSIEIVSFRSSEHYEPKDSYWKNAV